MDKEFLSVTVVGYCGVARTETTNKRKAVRIIHLLRIPWDTG